MLTCPNCGAALPQSARGLSRCTTGCGHEVQVKAFPAAFREHERGQAPETLVDDAESGCFYHPNKRAVIPCDMCGRFLCSLCELEVDGKHICPSCLGQARDENAAARPEERRVLYDRIASDLAIALILVPCCWYVMPLVAIPVVVFALRYWRTPTSVLSRSKWRMGLAILVACGLTAFWILGVSAIFVGGV